MPLPDLLHSLHGRDLGFLKIIAGLWRIELDVPNVRAALPMLTRAMLDPELANEIIGALPIAAQDALIALAEQDGLLSWAQFTRNYGDVRSMGAARRDRERPDLNPRTPAELLWYYGLIGQAFLDMPPEPQQYAYIPGDLLALLKIPERRMTNVLGRPTSPDETGYPIFVTDRVLDHACTLLAALRLQLPLDRIPSTQWTIPLPNLRALLFATGLLDANDMPLPEPVRHFLEAPRAQALARLASAWLRSSTYNEMRLLPGLVFEGDWLNDALQARTRVLEHLRRLPQDSWWSLAAFTSAIRERDPDFQRPAGDYDSWFIRRAGTDQYLRGFSAWDEVDGEVVRSLICGPLHWLGFPPPPSALPPGLPLYGKNSRHPVLQMKTGRSTSTATGSWTCRAWLHAQYATSLRALRTGPVKTTEPITIASRPYRWSAHVSRGCALRSLSACLKSTPALHSRQR